MAEKWNIGLMNSTRLLKIIKSLVTLGIITGCVAYPDKQYPHILLTPGIGCTNSVPLRFDVDIRNNGSAYFGVPTYESLNNCILAALSKVDIFSNVQSGGSRLQNGYRLKMTFEVNETDFGYNHDASAVFTAFCIPVINHFELKGVVYIYKDGVLISTLDNVRVYKSLVWLPLIVAAPFYTCHDAWRYVERDLVDALVAKTRDVINRDMNNKSSGLILPTNNSARTSKTNSIEKLDIDLMFGIKFGSDITQEMMVKGLLPTLVDGNEDEEYFDLGHPFLRNVNTDRRIDPDGSHNYKIEFVPWVINYNKYDKGVVCITAVSDRRNCSEVQLNKHALYWRNKFISMGLGDPEFLNKKKQCAWRWFVNDVKGRDCYIVIIIDRADGYMDKMDSALYLKVGLCTRQSNKASNSKSNNCKQIIDEKGREVFNKIKDKIAIVAVENKSAGSGFLASDSGKVYLYTNEHVARAGNPFRAELLDGTKLQLGEFQVAKNIDLARFEIGGTNSALNISHGIPNIGDSVYVFGNSDGAGVSTCIPGAILGVGPDRMEIDAEFIHGNSGSPVVNLDGEVVGVATYATYMNDKDDWTKAGTRFNDVRRFAVRIDKVEWQTIDWDLYIKLSEMIHQK